MRVYADRMLTGACNPMVLRRLCYADSSGLHLGLVVPAGAAIEVGNPFLGILLF